MKAEDLDRLLERPDEPKEKDAVVRFWVQWDGSPKTYSYCAVRYGTGAWALTGESPPDKSWTGILDWMDHRGGTVVGMEIATAWEKLL